MSKKIVRASELDPDFKFDIAKTHEGETVLWCVQCGMCTSNCPYSNVWDVKPHEIIKMILLGLREQALSCKSMWTCATCFMCAERCPQGVEVGNVMFALKNIATKERGIPEGLKLFGQQIYKTGLSAKITGFRKRERANLGLPTLPNVDVESIKRLLKKMKFDELIDEEEEETA